MHHHHNRRNGIPQPERVEPEELEDDDEELDGNTDHRDAYEYIESLITPELRSYIQNRNNAQIGIKSMIIYSIVNSDLESLKRYLPTRRNIKDRYGYNLLQIAICYQESVPIFEYLLSLGYDMEERDPQGDTSLLLALSAYNYGSNEPIFGDYYAYRLIENGANIRVRNHNFDLYTPLHHACDRGFYNTAALLISRGADVHMADNDGFTPLHVLLLSKRVQDWVRFELVCMLMAHKAFITEKEFDLSMRGKAYEVQRFLYNVISSDGDFNTYLIPALTLNQLLTSESQLFYELILENQLHIDIEDIDSENYNVNMLLFAEHFFLKWYLENYYEGAQILFSRSIVNIPDNEKFNCRMLKNLQVFFEDETLEWYVRDFFCRDILLRKSLVNHLTSRECPYQYEDLIGIIMTLLSYGVDFSLYDLECVFYKFGYCDLFRMMLMQDLRLDSPYYIVNHHVVPRLIYDIHLEIEEVYRNLASYDQRTVLCLLDYFVHPTLVEYCAALDTRESRVRIDRFTSYIPNLEQLARDSYRKCIVSTYKPRTTGEYITIVKDALPKNLFEIVALEACIYK